MKLLAPESLTVACLKGPSTSRHSDTVSISVVLKAGISVIQLPRATPTARRGSCIWKVLFHLSVSSSWINFSLGMPCWSCMTGSLSSALMLDLKNATIFLAWVRMLFIYFRGEFQCLLHHQVEGVGPHGAIQVASHIISRWKPCR